MLDNLTRITDGKTGRASSWDTSGRNADAWRIPPGESRVLADIQGPGVITHLWLTQRNHYRECLLKITWDGASRAECAGTAGRFLLPREQSGELLSIDPVHGVDQPPVRPSTRAALSTPMRPCRFGNARWVELVNESDEEHRQYFYVDYETVADMPADRGYFHAEFRRNNPFGGWGHEISVNTPEADIVNREEQAWRDNYVILETVGRGHYIGCNLSVANFQGTWWGEGDDMIWVDGYKWPPDLHGTGSEDYLNQAWGMQPNAFLRNGSSIHEDHTGGYQTSYVLHLENPVRFQREIKVTMEHGHGNHLANDWASVGYWYADTPTGIATPPPVGQTDAGAARQPGQLAPRSHRTDTPARRSR